MYSERCLIFIPILHTAADMMSLRSSIPRDKQDEDLAAARWGSIFRYLKHWPSPVINRLQVYQDGLPNTSEDDINTIFKQAKSINYDVLRWLRANGATIVGTENPSLMMEEYQHRIAMFHAPDEESWATAALMYFNRRGQLLKDRDGYIAQRIDQTLLPAGVGLLFIGLGHNIKPLLADKMRLREPKMFRRSQDA